jgi:hypothetical protein
VFCQGDNSVLLNEKLIDRLACNIDGHDDIHYRAVKNVGLERTRKNIEAFLELRDASGLKIPLHVLCINYHDYCSAIKRHFGFEPSNVKQPPSAPIGKDYKLIQAEWLPKLNPQIDSIEPVKFFLSWAEREKAAHLSIDYKQYTCPNIDRIRSQAFVAPDGRWYACCFDADCELIVGDTTQTPLIELVKSPRRSELLRLLDARKFQEIGGPCKTVNCCELISLHPLETRVRRFWRRRVKPKVQSLKKRLQ